MTDAAIMATYETYKHVPSRKVVQIVLEVPAEGQEALFKALGYPDPQKSIWVAVARLSEAAMQPEPEQIVAPIEPPGEKPPTRLSQIAGIISNEGAFAKFMRDVKGYAHTLEPAEALRLFCGIESRRDLDDTFNASARANFMSLKSEYEAWMRCDGVAA